MEYNSIDDLLAQLDCKIPEGEVVEDAGVEYTDNEEYVNFVMEEIIRGNASLDPSDSTSVTSLPIPPSEGLQHQEANLCAGSDLVNPGTTSGYQPNMWPVTASYISNGKPVVLIANTLGTNAACGQTLTSAFAAPTQSTALSSQPCATAFMQGNRVEIPSVIDQHSQNMIIVAQPPLVSQPREACAAATANLTSKTNNCIITNAFTPQGVQNPPVSKCLVSSAAVPASENAAATTPEQSESKKRKLYQESEFEDPIMEKRRRNAQNAKNHRDKTKLKIKELSEELEQTRKEREDFKTENEKLKLQIAQQEEVRREIQALRMENERLKAREQALAQQSKFGLQDFDLSDLFQ